MKIATWNIGGGFISSDSADVFDLEKIEYFIDELKKSKPDVVCLQEVHFSQNNDQTKIIANALGLDYYITEKIADSFLKEGEKLSIAIISKYPIISSKFYKLKNPNLTFEYKGRQALSHDKGFLEAKMTYHDRTVRILSGHMVPFHVFGRDFLEDEFKDIREQIEEIVCGEKLPTIICGDMNFEDMVRLIPGVFNEGFSLALNDEFTTPNDKKFDKIIISKDWESTKQKIIRGRADHYLCLVDLELK